MVILRAVNKAGETRFYNGKAGDAWLSSDQAEGFPYSVSGARRKATLFNQMTEIHGWHFTAWDTERQRIAAL